MSAVGECVVVDAGSGYMKSGLAGEVLPKLCCPTVVGHGEGAVLPLEETLYYGYEAIKQSCLLRLCYPIECGVIVSWEDFAELLHLCLRSAFVGTSNENVDAVNLVLSETPLRPRQDRQRLIEVLFEALNINGVHISPTNVLDLYAMGKVTGLVLDSGECVTSCLGVCEGAVALGSVFQHGFGGRDINEQIAEVLEKKHGLSLLTVAQRELARWLKEQHCELAADSPLAVSKRANAPQKSVTLPDGRPVTLDSVELSGFPELCFNPDFDTGTGTGSASGPAIGSGVGVGVGYGDFGGFAQILMQSIEKCAIDARPTLLRNVVLPFDKLLDSVWCRIMLLL